MTREEAIAILENEKECVNRANKNDYCNRDCYNCELVKTDTEILTALDMAISALSENKGDSISRQAVNILVDELARAISDERCFMPRGRDTEEIMSDILNLPSIENKGEWRPVSERLPEIHQDVLLELRSGEMLTGFKAETEPYFYCHGVDGCYVEPQNVIAWQPLPKPYKKEGE